MSSPSEWCHTGIIITNTKFFITIIIINSINMMMISAGKHGLPDGGPECPSTPKVYKPSIHFHHVNFCLYSGMIAKFLSKSSLASQISILWPFGSGRERRRRRRSTSRWRRSGRRRRRRRWPSSPGLSSSAGSPSSSWLWLPPSARDA